MYDVLIIGAGIVGTAIARRLSRYQLSVCLVEKSNDVAMGSTKAIMEREYGVPIDSRTDIQKEGAKRVTREKFLAYCREQEK